MKNVVVIVIGFSFFVSAYPISRPEITAIQNLVQEHSRPNASMALCEGRLTLTSGTPVTTSNVTGATTVYFTPMDGDVISLYDGSSKWQMLTFTEKSVAVPSTTTTPFDIFAYNNGGTLTLETANWTNDTTRATALTTLNGIYVKSGATTRRYLGTGRTTSVSGNTEDSSSSRFLWNMCHRISRKLLAQASTASWTYDTSTWRSAGGSTTTGQTRVEYIVGLALEPIHLRVFVPQLYHATLVTHAAGIGINSTSANSAQLFGGLSTPYYQHSTAYYNAIPSVGYSYAQWLEFGGGGTNQLVNANFSTNGKQIKAGITGQFWG